MDLEELRQDIDRIDHQIIELLGQRLKVVDAVGRYKQTHGLSARDNGRFESLMAKLKGLAKVHNVPADLVEKIYHEIHEASIAQQRGLGLK